jgi:hypothetical protein
VGHYRQHPYGPTVSWNRVVPATCKGRQTGSGQRHNLHQMPEPAWRRNPAPGLDHAVAWRQVPTWSSNKCGRIATLPGPGGRRPAIRRGDRRLAGGGAQQAHPGAQSGRLAGTVEPQNPNTSLGEVEAHLEDASGGRRTWSAPRLAGAVIVAPLPSRFARLGRAGDAGSTASELVGLARLPGVSARPPGRHGAPIGLVLRAELAVKGRLLVAVGEGGHGATDGHRVQQQPGLTQHQRLADDDCGDPPDTLGCGRTGRVRRRPGAGSARWVRGCRRPRPQSARRRAPARPRLLRAAPSPPSSAAPRPRRVGAVALASRSATSGPGPRRLLVAARSAPYCRPWPLPFALVVLPESRRLVVGRSVDPQRRRVHPFFRLSDAVVADVRGRARATPGGG